jgi:protein-S-isoprenylcysteine O-methyltransferase Ste14
MQVLRVTASVIFYLAFNTPLFLAGAWNWGRAWLLVAVTLSGHLIILASLARQRSGLLEERVKPVVQRDQPISDKILVLLLLATFLGLMTFIPLDVFRWRLLPQPGSLISSGGLVLVIAGLTVAYLSLRENAFAAPVVKHQEDRGHAVVDTGVYSLVRHPLYAGATAAFIGIPLWLESYAGAIFALSGIAVLAARIVFEERFLRGALAGYAAYAARVRYRLIPHVW